MIGAQAAVLKPRNNIPPSSAGPSTGTSESKLPTSSRPHEVDQEGAIQPVSHLKPLVSQLTA